MQYKKFLYSLRILPILQKQRYLQKKKKKSHLFKKNHLVPPIFPPSLSLSLSPTPPPDFFLFLLLTLQKKNKEKNFAVCFFWFRPPFPPLPFALILKAKKIFFPMCTFLTPPILPSSKKRKRCGGKEKKRVDRAVVCIVYEDRCVQRMCRPFRYQPHEPARVFPRR